MNVLSDTSFNSEDMFIDYTSSITSADFLANLPPYDCAPISEVTERIVNERQNSIALNSLQMNKTHSSFTLSLKIVLIALVFVVGATSGVLVWIGVTTANESVQDVVTHLRDHAINQVTTEFQNGLLRPLSVLQQIAYMTSTGMMNVTEDNRYDVFRLLFTTQHREPTAGYYIGMESNMFFQASPWNDTFFRRAWRPAGPLGAAIHSTTAHPMSNPLPETYSYIRNNFVYNTTLRPWYVAAKRDRAVAYTSIYVFATVIPQTGTTGVAPLYNAAGDFIGVAGMDFDLGFLSSMLSSIVIGHTGVSYIVEPSGLLIAASHGPSANGTLRIAARYSSNELISASSQMWNFMTLTNMTIRTTSSIGGTLLWIDIVPLRAANLNWIYVSVLPEDDFLGTAKTSELRLIIVATVVGGFCFLYAIFTVIAITRPLHRLRKGMDQIARMDVEQEVDSGSRLTEVARIEESYNGMVAALDSFSKFVPTSVIRNIIVSKESARPDLRSIEGAVMFMDIAGFTAMCERLPPDTLLEIVGVTFERSSEAVQANDGTVDKYIGDCMMAFWNAPEETRDYRFKCVKTAFECQQLVQRNNVTSLVPKYNVDLHIRIGIQAGPMKVGNFGSWRKLNYTVIGDTVNQASRFEGLNKEYGTTIMSGEKMIKGLEERVVFRLLDKVRVFGKREITSIYEIMGVVYPENMLRPEELDIQMRYIAVARRKAERYRIAWELMMKRQFMQALSGIQNVVDDPPCVRLRERCGPLEMKYLEAEHDDSLEVVVNYSKKL